LPLAVRGTAATTTTSSRAALTTTLSSCLVDGGRLDTLFARRTGLGGVLLAGWTTLATSSVTTRCLAAPPLTDALTATLATAPGGALYPDLSGFTAVATARFTALTTATTAATTATSAAFPTTTFALAALCKLSARCYGCSNGSWRRPRSDWLWYEPTEQTAEDSAKWWRRSCGGRFRRHHDRRRLRRRDAFDGRLQTDRLAIFTLALY
jgi:hypothetical protein